MEFYANAACKENPITLRQIPHPAGAKFWRNPLFKRKIIMRINLCILVIIAGLMQVSAATFAQKITLSEKNASLSQVLSQIRRQSGYDVICRDELLNKSAPVTVTLNNATLDDALKASLLDQALTYEIEDGTIIIKEKDASFIEKAKAFLAQLTISGKVLDENGQPLPGVTVRQKGTNNITTTDSKGVFSIDVPGDNTIIAFSYIGYVTQEIPVSRSENVLNINLKKSTSELDQVQVIAYGTQTKRFSIGSVTSVTAKDIAEQPVSNPLLALQGRVPGLVVTQTSGLPGGMVTIQIRGQNTISQQPGPAYPPLDQPLFIIDGVPFAPQNSSITQFASLASPIGVGVNSRYLNPYGGISAFNSINPQDIESIEVLRDADATSIYGSRGANGVVLITTKRGKAGKTDITSNVSSGISYVSRSIPFMNTQQYLQYWNQAFANDGIVPNNDPGTPGYFPYQSVFDNTRYTDWKKVFFGNPAYSTNVNETVSGGSPNTQFLIGAGYNRQTYVTPGDFSDNKMSLNSNLNHQSVDRKFQINLNINYSYDKNNSSGSPQALLAYTTAPNTPALINPDGSLLWNYKGISLQNSFGYLKASANAQTYNLNSSLQMSYEVAKGLTLRSTFGYNNVQVNEYAGNPIASQNPLSEPQSTVSFGSNNFQTWNIEPQLEYKKEIGKGRLDLLVGSTFEKDLNFLTNETGKNISNDALLGSLNASANQTASTGSSLYKYNAVFWRMNYIWDDKYILNITGRRDGSSKFGPGNQFGTFGSVGGGWIFSQENFLKNNFSALSFGKLRATYGTSGSDGSIGNYQYLSNWKPILNGNYSGSVGYYPTNLYQPDYHWAVNKKLEFGLDIGFLKDRILLNATWFQNRCGNQLVSYLLPSQTGFAGVTSNYPALVQNSGWELQLNAIPIKTNDFTWRSSLNVSIQRNTLLAFPGLATSPYYNSLFIGKSLDYRNGYQYLDVNPTTGVYEFASKNGPTSTPTLADDNVPVGDTNPQYYGGFINNFSYKGFQLDIVMQFARQLGRNYLGQVYSSGYASFSNLPVGMLNSWQKPGDIKKIQQSTTEYYSPGASTSLVYFVNSSGAYSDASYLRVKTVSLSYTLNSNFLRKIKVQSCRVYLNAQNLFTITNYVGDPESQNLYGVPPLKTIVAGLQFTF
jgi:TonB-linked SusC/RagA family outer membrane protein